MTNLFKSTLTRMHALKSKRPSTIAGITLDAGRLECVVLRRTNGSLQLLQSFSAALSLDPLTNEPELVGREIRNHLDTAGVRERHCIIGLPLTWALTAATKVPDLPEADVQSFLQIEAERGFASDVDTLNVASSLCAVAAGERQAMMVGIPKAHVDLLEQCLRAAQLKPVSFSIGITALHPAAAASSNGVLSLVLGQNHIGLQAVNQGGIVALRALEGVFEVDGGHHVIEGDRVARDIRVTLGQLPADIRGSLRTVRVYGPAEQARELVEKIAHRMTAMGLETSHVTAYPPGELGVDLPSGAVVSPAFSLAAEFLSGRNAQMEFLPPKVTAWQKFARKHSSGRLRQATLAAVLVVLVVGGMFGWQQWNLYKLNSQWAGMQTKVRELEDLQGQIRTFRPWFDESFRTLSILQALTAAFPEDGVVTAKTIEIRAPNIVSCSGVAQNNQAWLKTLDRLRTNSAVTEVKVDMIRGKAPALQFTFGFQWLEGGRNEH